jgi:hypothetical protein
LGTGGESRGDADAPREEEASSGGRGSAGVGGDWGRRESGERGGKKKSMTRGARSW